MLGGARSFGAVLVPIAVGLTACGSAGGPKYLLAKTQRCLDDEGLQAVRDHNTFLAGSQGNLKVEFGYGSPMVFVVFGNDAGEAKKIADRAVAAAHKSVALDEKTIRAGVQQTGNVFYYSDAGPLTQVARARVARCLK